MFLPRAPGKQLSWTVGATVPKYLVKMNEMKKKLSLKASTDEKLAFTSKLLGRGDRFVRGN